MSRQLLRRLGGLSAALLIAACGGGSSATTTTVATTTTTSSVTTATTVAPTTTTAATVTTSAQADPEAARLAAAGLIQVADLGPGWKEFRPAAGPQPFSVESCGNRPGGPFPKVTKDANQSGAFAQYDDAQLYVTSSTIVFPDEASALEYVAIRNSPEWIECRRAGLERDLEANTGHPITVTVEPEEEPFTHPLLAATTMFGLEEELENGETAGGGLFRQVFRQGRAILFVEVDTGVSTDEDTGTAGEQIVTAIDQALARLEA